MKKFFLFSVTLLALSTVVPQNAKAIINSPTPDGNIINSPTPDGNIINSPTPDGNIINSPTPDGNLW